MKDGRPPGPRGRGWESGYAWEKFTAAVHGMAESSASLQRRLANAYRFALIHLKPEDLAAESRWSFKSICRKLTRESAAGDEGDAMASALVLSDEEAEDVARKIVQIYDLLCAQRIDLLSTDG